MNLQVIDIIGPPALIECGHCHISRWFRIAIPRSVIKSTAGREVKFVRLIVQAERPSDALRNIILSDLILQRGLEILVIHRNLRLCSKILIYQTTSINSDYTRTLGPETSR